MYRSWPCTDLVMYWNWPAYVPKSIMYRMCPHVPKWTTVQNLCSEIVCTESILYRCGSTPFKSCWYPYESLVLARRPSGWNRPRAPVKVLPTLVGISECSNKESRRVNFDGRWTYHKLIFTTTQSGVMTPRWNKDRSTPRYGVEGTLCWRTTKVSAVLWAAVLN